MGVLGASGFDAKKENFDTLLPVVICHQLASYQRRMSGDG